MNVLLYPKEPWIMRRAAGIARTTGKPLQLARADAEQEHRQLQEQFGEIRRNAKAPIVHLDPDRLFD